MVDIPGWEQGIEKQGDKNIHPAVLPGLEALAAEMRHQSKAIGKRRWGNQEKLTAVRVWLTGAILPV